MSQIAGSPTSLGLYTLADMEDRVRRVALAELYAVDPTTGLEGTVPVIYDMIMSKTDIDQQLNKALNLNLIKIQQFGEDALIKTVFLSVSANQVSVALPVDLSMLKETMWLPYSVSSPRPEDWQPMPQLDTDQPAKFGGAGTAPTWHRDGNLMVFDSIITQDNPGGIRVRYVGWAMTLVNPTDTLSASQLARPLQEVIILEAAIMLMGQRRRLVPPEVTEQYNQAQEALMLAAVLLTKPANAQITSPYMVRAGFSGRVRRGRWS